MQGEQSPVVESGEWVDDYDMSDDDDYEADLEVKQEPQENKSDDYLKAIKARLPTEGPFMALVDTIPANQTEEEIRKLFDKCKITKFSSQRDPDHDDLQKVHLTLETQDDLAQALYLNQIDFCGRKIGVTIEESNARGGDKKDGRKPRDQYYQKSRDGHDQNRRGRGRGRGRDYDRDRQYSNSRGSRDSYGRYHRDDRPRRNGDDYEYVFASSNDPSRNKDRAPRVRSEDEINRRHEEIFGGADPREENLKNREESSAETVTQSSSSEGVERRGNSRYNNRRNNKRNNHTPNQKRNNNSGWTVVGGTVKTAKPQPKAEAAPKAPKTTNNKFSSLYDDDDEEEEEHSE